MTAPRTTPAKLPMPMLKNTPTSIKVIHQENGGHGEGVNQGIRNASGMYFKVVDSDDWLDAEALQKVMQTLRGFAAMEQPGGPADVQLCVRACGG